MDNRYVNITAFRAVILKVVIFMMLLMLSFLTVEISIIVTVLYFFLLGVFFSNIYKNVEEAIKNAITIEEKERNDE